MSGIERNIETEVNEVVGEIERLLERKRPVLVAFDGRSGVGKSTLVQMVADRVGGRVVVGDDFYAGGNDEVWVRVSAEEKVARGIDWRRMRTEVLEPLLAGKVASWHPLDFEEGVTLEPGPVILVDGVYSARPELTDLVDLAVLVEADDAVRRRRLVAREGREFMERWHSLWDTVEF